VWGEGPSPPGASSRHDVVQDELEAQARCRDIMERFSQTSYWKFRVDLLIALGRQGHAMRRGRLGVYQDQDLAVMEVCIRAASDWNEAVREAALRSLWRLADRGDQRVIDVLLLALEDFVHAVVRAALEGLRMVALERDETLMSKLASRLQTETVRELACLALKDAGGALRCAEDVSKLFQSSTNASERLWAGAMLARLASFVSTARPGAVEPSSQLREGNDFGAWECEGVCEEDQAQCAKLLIGALSRCIIDSDWNVQRMAVRVICTAIDEGYSHLVHESCAPYVPLAHRGHGEVVAFVQAMALQPGHGGEDNGDAGNVPEAEADIAHTLQVYNSLQPAYGKIARGEIELGRRALRSEATKVAGEWVSDYSVKQGDTIVVGPQRMFVQVTDVVPLNGGHEIYGKDRGGGTVYIPANSSSKSNLHYSLAPPRAHGSSGKRDGITTLPVVSQNALSTLPSGRRLAPGTGFPAPRFLQRRARAGVLQDEWADMSSEDIDVRNMSLHTESGGSSCSLTGPGQESLGIMDWLVLSEVEQVSRASRALPYGGEMQSAFQQDLQRNQRYYTFDNNLVQPSSQRPSIASKGSGFVPPAHGLGALAYPTSQRWCPVSNSAERTSHTRTKAASVPCD